MPRKIVVFLDTCVDYAILAVCLVAFAICAYATFDAAMVYYGARDSSMLKYKPELAGGAEVLRELSKDAVAWITVDGTNIDYPVMQGKDNNIYVNKDPYGDFSLSGSIFLDSRNSANFEDEYSLLYGHHMERGFMFGALDEYAKEGYLKKHRTGLLTTVEGQKYDINLFASMETEATEGVIFNPTEGTFGSVLAYIKSHASVCELDGVNGKTQLLALSTCTSADSLERTIVFGTLSKVA